MNRLAPTGNRLLDRMRAGEQQFGMFSTMADATLVELFGGTGFDWILIDAEHSTVSLEGIAERLRALRGSTVEPIVRPVWSDQFVIKRLLDAGVQNLMIPSVDSADEAARAVSFTRYPPAGVRGVTGIARAARYGQDRQYLQHAANRLCVIAQIETTTGLENLEAIATTPGIDAVFIGPSDLAASLGHLGNAAHPDVQEAIDDAFERLGRINARTGYLALNPAEARRRQAEGIHVLGVAADTLLVHRGLTALGAELNLPIAPEGFR